MKTKIQNFLNKRASLALQIAQQQELTTQLSKQIHGSGGPLANFLNTPILGDQKNSRTSGLNSSPQAKAIQKQHSPATHREVGKKYADLQRDVMYYSALPTTALSIYRGVNDQENDITPTRGALTTAGLTSAFGALGALAHQMLEPHKYRSLRARILAPIAAAAITGTAGAALYGAARSANPLLEKFIYEQDSTDS